ncbi:hypothetical protein VB711_04780 [Cronbergia sp. UHCC 0137]|uniref:hypothetical protein n=1 Tax=Cronbergia sp. UHCC 0137 TaxID=3110239 RepID=UPI002B201E3C|nr:hypothetical protein [Cronbergia sp. UHCC 0137]MEA5617153.1 hypothetical protein [Cronbergia sp. UHCC 0137]
MEEKRVNYLEQISPEDWGKTPTSVKKLVEEMAQQIEQQSKKLGNSQQTQAGSE